MSSFSTLPLRAPTSAPTSTRVGLPRSKSFSFLVVLRKSGFQTRFSPETATPWGQTRRQRVPVASAVSRAAPLLLAWVARLGSPEIRYRAAVSLRAIPGWKKMGKLLCTFPRSVGWACSGSGYRQVSLAGGRAQGARELLGRRTLAVPGASTRLTTVWRGAPTAALEAVHTVIPRTHGSRGRGRVANSPTRANCS